MAQDYPYPLVTVGGLVVAPDGEILLVESRKWNGCYTVPGGKVEQGETRESAFVREIKEETGLAICNVRFVQMHESIFSKEFKGNKHLIMNDFVADLAPGYSKEQVALNDEAETFIWIRPERAKELKLNRELYQLIDWYLANAAPDRKSSQRQIGWTLVTGGAKRLGSIVCLKLARAGYNVIVHYHTSAKEANEVAAKCRAYGVQSEVIQGDLGSNEGVEILAEALALRFPELSNIVNNVGNYLIKPILDTSKEELIELYQTNFFAPFRLIQRLLPSVKKYKGAIINLGVAGLETRRAECRSTAYTLTKLSLLGLTKSLAKDLASSGVRVNMISPGYIDNAVDLPNDLSCLPMGRAATCDEIASLILFLLGRDGEYVTGQNIEVAGGVRL